MKLKCIVCAILAASVFFSTFGFASRDNSEDDHLSGLLNDTRRSTQDEKITDPTAKYGRYFSYETSEAAKIAEFKKRFETEQFEGKTLVQGLNAVKKFSEPAIEARKTPTESAIEKERTIAKAIGRMLFGVNQKDYDALGAELVKVVDGYRFESGSDTQTEEFEKRLLVAMQNFSPLEEEKKDVPPKNEEMNAFYEAWKVVRKEVEKELADQRKLRDDALVNENARNRLLEGDEAVGEDFAKQLNKMIQAGETEEAKKWIKALNPEGRLAFNNAKGEPVFMNTKGLSDAGLKGTFADEKMLSAKFVGQPHPDNSNAKDWIWTKNGVAVRPAVSPLTAGTGALASSATGDAGNASALGSRAAGALSSGSRDGASLFQNNCVGCHQNGAALSPKGAEYVRTSVMPKNLAKSQALSGEDREAIARYIEEQLRIRQVAGR